MYIEINNRKTGKAIAKRNLYDGYIDYNGDSINHECYYDDTINSPAVREASTFAGVQSMSRLWNMQKENYGCY